MEKKYSIKNPVMFAIVMQDTQLCVGLLERIFPGRKIKDLRFVYAASEDDEQLEIIREVQRIAEKNVPETEKSIIVDMEAKSVRMDVLFEDDEVWYNVEMQVENVNDPKKRSRYYHAMKAVDSLKSGDKYDALKPGYVIFICCFDLFELDKPVYSFQMYDENLCLPLGDGQYTMFLNGTCKNNVPKELASFYHYLRTGEVESEDIWLQQIDAAVEEANLRKEVRRKVTLYDDMEMLKRSLEKIEAVIADKEAIIALKETVIADMDAAIADKDAAIADKDAAIADKDAAIADKDAAIADKDAAIAELTAMMKLNARLAQEGRSDDIVRASEDADYRRLLMQEMGIE